MTSRQQQEQLRRLKRIEQYDSASSGGSDDDDDSSNGNDVRAMENPSSVRQRRKTLTVDDGGDESFDSSSDEEENDNGRNRSHNERKRKRNPENSEDGEASSSSGDYSNDGSDNNNYYYSNEEMDRDDDADTNNSDSESEEDSNDDDDDDDDDSNSSDSEASIQDLPLQERLRRKEEQSKNFQSVRQRKSQALQEASQRLAQLKQKKTKEQRNNDSDNDDDDKDDADVAMQKKKTKKKKSKHRPTEVSSKRSDFFRRGAPKLNESGIGVEIGAKRYKPIDPRVSSLSGHFNQDQFQRNYAFLEEMRNQEIGQCRKRIAAFKATGDRGRRLRRKLGLDGSDPSGLEEEEARLKTLTQERANLERSKIDRTAQRNVKAKIREQVASGQRGAYFLKRKEKKSLEMEEKLKELQKRGGKKAVDKMLDRKRRKNKSRDAGMFAK
ncbi:rRNA biogenesis protein RRP36 [Nitzschia inconspicua]|uniref:rRNA biogenesis protein RRP36 n=1 Tax=Nitzschia inconspicua TaxID=303405 RepID=A0A9K3KED6_9STRA|nr:rRNA biogenesis protein RRP36 [Nitzschia inconspicua]